MHPGSGQSRSPGSCRSCRIALRTSSWRAPSSRTYGGWALPRPDGRGPGNSEPFLYESGFAVKWLVGRQLQGKDPAVISTRPRARLKCLAELGRLSVDQRAKPRGDGLFFAYDDFTEQDRMDEYAGRTAERSGNLLLKVLQDRPDGEELVVRPVGR